MGSEGRGSEGKRRYEEEGGIDWTTSTPSYVGKKSAVSAFMMLEGSSMNCHHSRADRFIAA